MKPLTLVAVSTLALMTFGFDGASSARAAGVGSIRGIIRDGSGNPLAGAAVQVVAEIEREKADKVVKLSNTDKDGKFIASGIAPGRYRLKAEAAGFKTVEVAALVRPIRLPYLIRF